MNRKLIIDGNAVYEIDEKCMLQRRLEEDVRHRQPNQGKIRQEPFNQNRKSLDE